VKKQIVESAVNTAVVLSLLVGLSVAANKLAPEQPIEVKCLQEAPCKPDDFACWQQQQPITVRPDQIFDY
jgi:hypothetical protein